MRLPGLARLGVLAAACALALGLGGPAWAASLVVLNPAHANTTAQAFGSHDCTGGLSGLPATKDGWHFVLPATSGDDFLSMTLQFSTPGGPVVVGPITSSDAANPTTGTGWSGYFDNAAMAEKHAYVVTDAGWTLLGGTAQVDPDGHNGDNFNLSHTCPGTARPSESPSPGPSTPATTAPPVTTGTSPGRKPSGGASTGGGGSQGSGGLLLGLGALALAGTAGLGLVVARRRRDVA